MIQFNKIIVNAQPIQTTKISAGVVTFPFKQKKTIALTVSAINKR
jgi:hypothetical protein